VPADKDPCCSIFEPQGVGDRNGLRPMNLNRRMLAGPTRAESGGMLIQAPAEIDRSSDVPIPPLQLEHVQHGHACILPALVAKHTYMVNAYTRTSASAMTAKKGEKGTPIRSWARLEASSLAVEGKYRTP
jgi:hypothetical protein